MRIVCPDCHATYDVPHSVLGSLDRVVRCARCGHEWRPAAQPADSIIERAESRDPPMAAHAAPERPLVAERTGPLAGVPSGRPDASGQRAAAIGWVVTAVVLAAVLTGSALWRETIERAWPPIGRVYAVLGLP